MKKEYRNYYENNGSYQPRDNRKVPYHDIKLECRPIVHNKTSEELELEEEIRKEKQYLPPESWVKSLVPITKDNIYICMPRIISTKKL